MEIAKVIILGNMSVGKTSLHRRFMGDGFSTSYLPTLGADFSKKDIELENDNQIRLQIWDIAGQQSFDLVRKGFYANSNGILLVFDVTEPQSFRDLDNWLEEFRSEEEAKIPILVIGNKIDLKDERKVTRQDTEEYIDKLKNEQDYEGIFIDYLETSAKTGENVNEGFERLANQIFKQYK